MQKAHEFPCIRVIKTLNVTIFAILVAVTYHLMSYIYALNSPFSASLLTLVAANKWTERDRKKEQKINIECVATASDCKELITQYSCEYILYYHYLCWTRNLQYCCVWVRRVRFFLLTVCHHNKNKMFLTRERASCTWHETRKFVNALQELWLYFYHLASSRDWIVECLRKTYELDERKGKKSIDAIRFEISMNGGTCICDTL